MLPLYTKEGLGLHKKTFAFAVFIITRRSWCGEVTDMEPVCIRRRGASRIVWARRTDHKLGQRPTKTFSGTVRQMVLDLQEKAIHITGSMIAQWFVHDDRETAVIIA